MVGKNRKKLLILMTGYAIGGVERTAADLAREFKARDWDVRAVFAQPPDEAARAALLKWCRGQGVEAETSPALKDALLPHSWGDVLSLRRFVAAHRPDVVNIHYGHNFIPLKDVLAVRLAGLARLVVSIHHPEPWGEGPRHRINTGRASRLCAALVVPSRATRQRLREADVPARKIRIIPSGVPVPTRRPSRADARARLGLPPDAFIVGCLARLEPHKSIGDLIEAAARVPDPNDRLRVVIAGDGTERAALEDLAAARLGPRATFLGRVPDEAIPDIYAAFDLFCLPSRLEGFGLVYIEAAFHGVPSVGADIGGVPDVIIDGETGLLVPPGDQAAIAAAIVRLRDDPALRQRMGEAARARAHAEFTVGRMTERYTKVFRS